LLSRFHWSDPLLATNATNIIFLFISKHYALDNQQSQPKYDFQLFILFFILLVCVRFLLDISFLDRVFDDLSDFRLKALLNTDLGDAGQNIEFF